MVDVEIYNVTYSTRKNAILNKIDCFFFPSGTNYLWKLCYEISLAFGSWNTFWPQLISDDVNSVSLFVPCMFLSERIVLMLLLFMTFFLLTRSHRCHWFQKLCSSENKMCPCIAHSKTTLYSGWALERLLVILLVKRDF